MHKIIRNSVNPAFHELIDSKSQIRLSCGGAGAGRSYAMFIEAIVDSCHKDNCNYLVLRNNSRQNRLSTVQHIKQISKMLELDSYFKENKLSHTFTCVMNNNTISFSGFDELNKIKTLAIDDLMNIVVEEASEVSKDDFDQLLEMLKMKFHGTGKQFQITLLFNTGDYRHWIYQEFFKKKSYQKNVTVYMLHTTYLNNDHIDDDYVNVLESYKETDIDFYRNYVQGQWILNKIGDKS